MKNMMIALALVASSAFTANQAQAFPSATPLWACHLSATATHDNRFYVLIRAGELNATGTMNCVSLTGRTSSANVNVSIRELGVGIGFGFPVENAKLDILQVKAGVASPRGMYGKYSLQAGPGLTLIGARVSAEGGVEFTPCAEAAAKVQVRVEQMVGLGIDFSASTMTITPAQALR